MTRRNLFSVALGFAGIAIVFGPEAYRGEVSGHWLGDGRCFCGPNAAIYSVFGQPMFGKHGAMFVMVLAVVFGLLTLTLLAAAGGVLSSWPTFSRSGWIAVTFLGTLGAAVQFSLLQVGAALAAAVSRRHLSDAQSDRGDPARQPVPW